MLQRENITFFATIPVAVLFIFALLSPTAHAILAGGEFDLPADIPSNRSS